MRVKKKFKKYDTKWWRMSLNRIKLVKCQLFSVIGIFVLLLTGSFPEIGIIFFWVIRDFEQHRGKEDQREEYKKEGRERKE